MPLVITKTLIVDPAGNILFLKRSDDDVNRPGEWDLPGGGVDSGEDPTTAAIREADEEAGITLKDPRLVFGIAADPGDKPKVRLIFIEYVTSIPVVVLSHEHSDYAWMSVEQALKDWNHPVYSRALLYVQRQGLLDAGNAGNIAVTCRSLVYNSEGKILIARRGPTDTFHPGSWDLPGGRLEAGETLEAAVIRETQEEVGLTLSRPDVLYAITALRPPKSASWVFFASQTTNEPVLGSEHDALQWISLDELPHYTNYDILTGMQQFVSASLQK
ncbi:MAG TPA: NUDIX hydrolase [Bacillota bacterium]|nr:NUDIX hydrolase [Bacillota bacterium]